MSTIGISAVKESLAEFIDQRVLAAISGDQQMLKWIIGGASALYLTRLDKVVESYAPMLKSIGVMDESRNIDIGAAELFINSAFSKQESVRLPVLGVPITFDKSDGDALIQIMKRRAGA